MLLTFLGFVALGTIGPRMVGRRPFFYAALVAKANLYGLVHFVVLHPPPALGALIALGRRLAVRSVMSDRAPPAAILMGRAVLVLLPVRWPKLRSSHEMWLSNKSIASRKYFSRRVLYAMREMWCGKPLFVSPRQIGVQGFSSSAT